MCLLYFIYASGFGSISAAWVCGLVAHAWHFCMFNEVFHDVVGFPCGGGFVCACVVFVHI